MMPTTVHPAVERLEARLRDGTARIEQFFPKGHFPCGQDVAKRCQHCSEPVAMGTVHSWAIVECERDDGDDTACYPVFCDPTCLHEWAVEVDESEETAVRQ